MLEINTFQIQPTANVLGTLSKSTRFKLNQNLVPGTLENKLFQIKPETNVPKPLEIKLVEINQ